MSKHQKKLRKEQERLEEQYGGGALGVGVSGVSGCEAGYSDRESAGSLDLADWLDKKGVKDDVRQKVTLFE